MIQNQLMYVKFVKISISKDYAESANQSKIRNIKKIGDDAESFNGGKIKNLK